LVSGYDDDDVDEYVSYALLILSHDSVSLPDGGKSNEDVINSNYSRQSRLDHPD